MKRYISDKDYSFIYNMSPRVCIDIVMMVNNGVVLVKRDTDPNRGKWNLPGGGIRFRESICDAICRIAKREIGCSVRAYKHIGFMEFLKEKAGENKRHSISLVFQVFADGEINRTGFKKLPSNIIREHKIFIKKNNILS